MRRACRHRADSDGDRRGDGVLDGLTKPESSRTLGRRRSVLDHERNEADVISDDATRTAAVVFDADRTVMLMVDGSSAVLVGIVIS